MLKTTLHNKHYYLQFTMWKLRFRKFKILAQRHSWSVNAEIWIQVSLTPKSVFFPLYTALLTVKEQDFGHKWPWERTRKWFIKSFPVPEFPPFDRSVFLLLIYKYIMRHLVRYNTGWDIIFYICGLLLYQKSRWDFLCLVLGELMPAVFHRGDSAQSTVAIF